MILALCLKCRSHLFSFASCAYRCLQTKQTRNCTLNHQLGQTMYLIIHVPFSNPAICPFSVSFCCSTSIFWSSMVLNFLWIASRIFVSRTVSCLRPLISSSFAFSSAAFCVFSVANWSQFSSCWSKSCWTLVSRAFSRSVSFMAFSFKIWHKNRKNRWAPKLLINNYY